MLNKKGRSQLSKGLQRLGLEILPSYANFICVDLKGPSWPIYRQLLLHGISVRPLHDYGLYNFLRVSIGTGKQIKCFLNVLEKILVESNIAKYNAI